MLQFAHQTIQSSPPPRIVIVMGVSGSGKSVIGQHLASAWHAQFHDADAFHPPENIAKMSRSIPLTDEDRQPWLQKMHQKIVAAPDNTGRHVLACSALKRSYRDFLRGGCPDVGFVYLNGSFELIHERISARQDHYMKSDLLRSQFTTLEDPSGEPQTLVISIAGPIDEIVSTILSHWALPAELE
jgi:gluconokinase